MKEGLIAKEIEKLREMIIEKDKSTNIWNTKLLEVATHCLAASIAHGGFYAASAMREKQLTGSIEYAKILIDLCEDVIQEMEEE